MPPNPPLEKGATFSGDYYNQRSFVRNNGRPIVSLQEQCSLGWSSSTCNVASLVIWTGKELTEFMDDSTRTECDITLTVFGYPEFGDPDLPFVWQRELVIGRNMTIRGEGLGSWGGRSIFPKSIHPKGPTTVSVGDGHRVLRVLPGAHVVLCGLHFAGPSALREGGVSHAMPQATVGDGGAFHVSGGVLTLSDCSVVGFATAPGFNGGAIFVDRDGMVGLAYTNLTANMAVAARDTGVGGYGGALYISSGSALLQGSRLAHNVAVRGGGGGVYVPARSSLVLTDCELSANDAVSGGGVYLHSEGAASPPSRATGTVQPLLIENSRFSGNVAQLGGRDLTLASTASFPCGAEREAWCGAPTRSSPPGASHSAQASLSLPPPLPPLLPTREAPLLSPLEYDETRLTPNPPLTRGVSWREETRGWAPIWDPTPAAFNVSFAESVDGDALFAAATVEGSSFEEGAEAAGQDVQQPAGAVASIATAFPIDWRCPTGYWTSTMLTTAYRGGFAGCPLPCGAGFYADSSERRGCSACTAGHYCPYPSTLSPLACPAGTLWPNTSAPSNASCLPCAAGTYSTIEGNANSTCAACPPELVSSHDRTGCVEPPSRSAALVGGILGGLAVAMLAAALLFWRRPRRRTPKGGFFGSLDQPFATSTFASGPASASAFTASGRVASPLDLDRHALGTEADRYMVELGASHSQPRELLCFAW